MGLPLPSHGRLCLPGHLPACGAEAGCVTNLVTVVQHTGYPCPQAREEQLDRKLPPNYFLDLLLETGMASLPGQLLYPGQNIHEL